MPTVTFMNLDSPTQTATGKTMSTGCKWQGDPIGLTYGGTGTASTPSNGQLLIGGNNIYNANPLTVQGITQTLGVGTITLAANLLAQGRLKYSATNSLTFTRENGQWIPINGTYRSIPSAGLSTTNTSLPHSTRFYVYATMNSASTMELFLHPTGHETHTDGVEIMTGDALKTLVGMASTNASGQFMQSATGNLVLSWFNRRSLETATPLTASINSNSGTFVELGSGFTGFRIGFLTWNDEPVIVNVNGVWRGGANMGYTSIGIDAGTATQASNVWQAGVYGPLAINFATKLSEGYHYACLVGRSDGGTTYTWEGNANTGERCTLEVRVMG